jgi:transcription-repair coupling factor (superfamily II helicase)
MAATDAAKKVSEALKRPRFNCINIGGLVCSAASLLVASLKSKTKIIPPMLIVLNDMEEAGYFYNDIVQLIGDKQILLFPSSYRRAIKYNQKDASYEILRTDVLGKVGKEERLFVVTCPEALAEKVLTPKELDENTLTVSVNDTIDFNFLEEWLEQHGFIRTDYVYEPGQFAIRGSIVDIYSFSMEDPIRLDFFGDTVDSIRTFDIQTQCSDSDCQKVAIVPEMERDNQEYIQFLDYLPDDYIIVAKDLQWIYNKVETICEEGFAKQADIEAKEMSDKETAGNDNYTPQFQRLVVNYSDFVRRMQQRRKMLFSPARRGEVETDGKGTVYIEFLTAPQPLFHRNFQMFRDECAKLKDDGYQVVILTDGAKQTERLREILTTNEIPGNTLSPNSVDMMECTLHQGFIDHENRLAVFTDHEIFDRFHKYNLRSDKAKRGKMALTLKEIQQFEVGGYVVHIDHGVGRFDGLIRVPINGVMQEMIKVTYLNGGFIYMSIHSLHKLSKYKGKEGEPPRMNRLGTGAWERMKGRVKAKVKDIARDLIKLYADRLQQKGFAFSPDSYMQQELEASFIYEDTPDQIKATREVKEDMESERPMDRLICGDVGFGKTEIAVRAAFKAAADSKQVAILVPTTVLAYQHYHTFSQRLREFPVKVDYLTRARTSKELRVILDDLKSGKTDIIIGTHKLIGKDVQFKDLGLLIIDEEQKFGVGVKEKLRQMKVNVDTLTMTATPIPRTLQFSLMGARDLSVITTPPPNRYPIQTEIHSLSPEIVAEAINFELSRNGQVFFVNNRISDLESLKKMIERHVPDARVCVGHGRMEPKELEHVLIDFFNHDYDVLLSTTIVENGIDVPNANTIIINSAHNYGLSDLHQMRGRVGRSNKKAFCYLLAPPLAGLPDHARRRLQALESFSELGAGLNIAMQDLDIRGAGNLLGAEQSGFIADLGYETYQKVLAEAVSELKATEFADVWAKQEDEDSKGDSTEKKIDFGITFVNECNIETDIPASFAETYIPTSGERMALYRELDGLKNIHELEAYSGRIKDRFGPIPREGEELLRIMPLKWLACKLGIERLILKQKTMFAYLVENHESPYYKSTAFGKLLQFATQYFRRCKLMDGTKRSLRIDNVSSVKEALEILTEINDL